MLCTKLFFFKEWFIFLNRLSCLCIFIKVDFSLTVVILNVKVNVHFPNDHRDLLRQVSVPEGICSMNISLQSKRKWMFAIVSYSFLAWCSHKQQLIALRNNVVFTDGNLVSQEKITNSFQKEFAKILKLTLSGHCKHRVAKNCMVAVAPPRERFWKNLLLCYFNFEYVFQKYTAIGL
jgi:hypothetical protein